MGEHAADERNIYLEDIPLEEAQARLQAALREAGRDGPLPGERVPLDEAVGRVTADAGRIRRAALPRGGDGRLRGPGRTRSALPRRDHCGCASRSRRSRSTQAHRCRSRITP